MSEVPVWMVEKVVRLLRAHPLGLTRTEIVRHLGYRSVSSITATMRHLMDTEQVRTVFGKFKMENPEDV